MKAQREDMEPEYRGRCPEGRGSAGKTSAGLPWKGVPWCGCAGVAELAQTGTPFAPLSAFRGVTLPTGSEIMF